MSAWANVRKFAAMAVGTSTGIGIYLYMNRVRESPQVMAGWTTNTVVSPEAKWDWNWDQ